MIECGCTPNKKNYSSHISKHTHYRVTSPPYTHLLRSSWSARLLLSSKQYTRHEIPPKFGLMKMAFNGGCDTDGGPHNKRLCTGQNNTIINDNNNNTNGSGLSNGTGLLDIDMNKGLGLVRVNFPAHFDPFSPLSSLYSQHDTDTDGFNLIYNASHPHRISKSLNLLQKKIFMNSKLNLPLTEPHRHFCFFLPTPHSSSLWLMMFFTLQTPSLTLGKLSNLQNSSHSQPNYRVAILPLFAYLQFSRFAPHRVIFSFCKLNEHDSYRRDHSYTESADFLSTEKITGCNRHRRFIIACSNS